MNVIIKSENKKATRTKASSSNPVSISLLEGFIGFLCFTAFIIGVIMLVSFLGVQWGDSDSPDTSNHLVESASFQSMVEPLAQSYNIPYEPMVRLADYISFHKDLFSGVGLFAVRAEDLKWIQDKVLLETNINLSDDLQNAQVAAYLLKRFHDSGYSWKESFLIYAFGFPAIHGSQHQDFVDFIGF